MDLSPTEFASAVTAIASAFGDPTRRDIFLHVHERADGVTASEVAERFDLHANVARHHLDKLAAGGYLEVGIERAGGGGAGRPSKRYRATEPEMSLEINVGHDDVLPHMWTSCGQLSPRGRSGTIDLGTGCRRAAHPRPSTVPVHDVASLSPPSSTPRRQNDTRSDQH